MPDALVSVPSAAFFAGMSDMPIGCVPIDEHAESASAAASAPIREKRLRDSVTITPVGDKELTAARMPTGARHGLFPCSNQEQRRQAEEDEKAARIGDRRDHH